MRNASWWALVFLLVAVVLGGGPAGADDPVSKADLQRLKVLAGQGDAHASLLLGNRYAAGEGVQVDDVQALQWFAKAAKHGLAEAQYNIGVMFATGRGVEKDLSQAARWYRLAAQQGVGEAQLNLGNLYLLGQGVQKDENAAAHWLRRAAEQGQSQAQYNLALLLESGRGVPQDKVDALSWYDKAVEQGHRKAIPRRDALRKQLKAASMGKSSAWSADPLLNQLEQGKKAPVAGTKQEKISIAAAAIPVPALESLPATPEIKVSAVTEKVQAQAVAKRKTADPASAGRKSVQVAEQQAAGAGVKLAAEWRAGAEWVDAQEAQHFTIQLLSVSKPENLDLFIRRHNIEGEVKKFVFKRKGVVWYSLVYGLYYTEAEARSAIAALPPKLRVAKPWPRNFSLIRETLVRD